MVDLTFRLFAIAINRLMTTQVLTNAEKIRKLPWNTGLGAFNNIFAQLTYFGPAFVLFLNELNFSNTQIGLLLSFMPFTGLVALVIAPGVARFGYKRTFLTFWGMRTIITGALLLVPWVLSQFGLYAVSILVTLVVFGFSLCRAIAEVGLYPWVQEFVPDSLRGRHGAINDMAARLTGISSIAVASFVLSLPGGLERYMALFGVALIFGFLTVWSASHLPGGAPIRGKDAAVVSYRDFWGVLRDRNFLLYIMAVCILTVGITPMMSFLPLFMENEIGLSESRVVLLQIGMLIGGLSSTYLFGWAADRYGSKPVMLTGVLMRVLLPIFWMLLPRNSDLSLPAALLISLVSGSAEIAWLLGSSRLLYVKVVPQQKRAEYMAVYYAIIGLIGGLSQFIGGGILDYTQGLSGQFLIFPIDPFFPLFMLGLILTIATVIILKYVEADSPVSMSEFAGMFLQGNPILALESMFRYYRAREESEVVAATERMGQIKSLLTVDELLESLKDPRFNVRFEAVISIAHMESDPRLVEALCHILEGTELSLSVVAAWALGRIGQHDDCAIRTLRQSLDTPYRSIQAHAARSLGTLGDRESAPLLLERLQKETDKGLRIAYSSALGKLGAVEAVDTLMDVLLNTANEGARMELSLALVRLVGYEHHFIRMLRNYRQDSGTTASQALMVFKRRLHHNDAALDTLINECEIAFATDDLAKGAQLLQQVIDQLPAEFHTSANQKILRECSLRMAEFKAARPEYILLALHTLDAAVV
jgi:MFS transporter, MHS family, proline/betaine transporter